VNRIAAEAFTEIGLPGLVLAGAARRAPARTARRGCSRAGGRTWTARRSWTPATGSRCTSSPRCSRRWRCSGWSPTAGRPGCSRERLPAHGSSRGRLRHRQGTAHPYGRGRPPPGPPADRTPDLVTHPGPILPCDSEWGVFRVSRGRSAALGQLAADITGSPYPDAVARLVFRPLGMTGSSFPSSWPRDSAAAGYSVPACRAA
jgi:hypothetical protein